jgi:hypothetical protein
MTVDLRARTSRWYHDPFVRWGERVIVYHGSGTA